MTSTTPNFDFAAKPTTVDLIAATKNGGILSATKNGAAYAVVPNDMEIDHVELMYALSADVNTDGAGYITVIVYENGVALWTSTALRVGYASAINYATIDRAALSQTALTKGRELRLDITATFTGAATAYPENLVVRIVGVGK